REALVLLGDIADQLLDEDRLADSGTAEQADLAALGVGGEQVDDLDSSLQDLLGRSQVLDLGGGPVDRPTLLHLDLRALVDRFPQQVEDAAERLLADRDRDRCARVDDPVAALHPVCRVHCDGADAVVTEVLLDLADQPVLGSPTFGWDVDLEGVVDLGHVAWERDVDDDTRYLLDGADLLAVARAVLG